MVAVLRRGIRLSRAKLGAAQLIAAVAGREGAVKQVVTGRPAAGGDFYLLDDKERPATAPLDR
jgi:hypothetical protein